MRKLYLFFSILLSVLLFSCSEDESFHNKDLDSSKESTFIASDEAMAIAKQFIEGQKLFGTETRSSEMNLEMVYTDLDGAVETKGSQKPSYYIFNIEKGGYVIIAADKKVLPVLGFSTESKFDKTVIPTNMQDVLADFKAEINYVRENNNINLATVAQARENILNGVVLQTRAGDKKAIAPLLGRIKWNQSPYYNKYCPPNTPVGCVATAQSQIMYYWKYPKESKGYHSYNHPRFGALSFNYDRKINWDAMQPEVLRRANEEIAVFCYGVAVSLDMHFDYGYNGGSGTYQDYVPRSLAKYYGYPSDIKNLRRNRYSDLKWMEMIYTELAAGRPVQYAGYGNGGGHSFVCDGYHSNGYFHFNWGWGGMADGYFLIDALNPGSLGDGGGAGGFNRGQQAVFGFQPPKGADNNSGDDNNDDEVENITVPTGLQAKNIAADEALLTWNKVDGAKSYTVQLRKKYYYSWITLKATSNQLNVKNLAEKTSYEWRVRAEGKTKYSTYSLVKEFRTAEKVVDPVEPDPVDPDPVDPDEPNNGYCISKSNDSESLYIRDVTVGYMSNYTYGGSSEGYGDYTYRNIFASPGDKLKYEFTPGFKNSAKYVYWGAWVDFDNDGEFEYNERFARAVGSQSVSGTLSIPSNLKKGKYRVRISMHSRYYPYACETLRGGEVEDYTLYIR